MPTAFLKPRRALPFFARHPWVFAGAVERIEGDPRDGDTIDLRTTAGNWVARGFYNSQSKIRIRLYTWDESEAIDSDFLRRRLQRAIALREELGLRGAERGCRLVFSEADGLSGCTVDEYAGWLTIQFTSLGLANRREEIADLLGELLQPKGMYIRTEKGIATLEGLELRDGLLRGQLPPIDLAIEENGLSFLVNLAEGQKTGFYHDQRDNRQAVARLSQGKRVLDAFSYTGAFGLHAAKAGAKSVDCIDVSQAALDLAKQNAERNGLSQVAFHKADVFKHLNQQAASGPQYDLIVLDPPKLARTRSSIPEAMRGYRHLYQSGVRLVERGGYVVFCCCSGLIEANAVAEVIAQVAGEERRDVQIIERRGAASDHPVSASCLETAYLKCFITRVS